MAEVFNSYVSDISKSIQTTKSELNSCSQYPLSKNLSQQIIAKKQSSLPSLKVQMYEIQKLIKLMQTEIVSFTGKQKNLSIQKVKGYKMQYETLRKKILNLQDLIKNERQKSKNNTTPNTTSHSLQLNERKSTRKSRKDKYSKLQDQRLQTEDVNQKLKQSKRVMYEISDMSDNIGYQLKLQTDSIENSVSKLGKIRNELMKGEKKIKKMMVRLRRNQLVFYLVILMMIIMAALIVSKIFI